MERYGPAEDSGGTGHPVAESYRCGPVVVDAGAHVLTRDGAAHPVEPKAFAVLLVLLRHAGELVTHEKLLDAVWGHRHVTPGVLTRAIAQLRAALDDHPHQPRYIQTVHALGYRFIGDLAADTPAAPSPVIRAAAEALVAPQVAPAAEIKTESPAAAEERPAGARDPPRPVDDGPHPAAAAPVAAAVPPPHEDAPRRLPRRLAIPGLLALLLLSLAALLWSNRDNLPSRQPAAASIAVLPFTSLSSDDEDGYFAEGLSIEMQGALAGVPGLQVAARSSATAAARRNTDVRELGRMLGVATVLDASVRREGQRVRIDARLSDTHSGYVLWSQSYDRELADVFGVQTEIAGEVVRALLGVLPREGTALDARLAPTRDIDAYEAYLKGLQQLQDTEGDEQMQSAIGHFRQALVADSGFARAQAGICRAEIMRFEYARDASAFERAQTACLKAARMDPKLREVSLALGEMHRVRGEFEQAARHYTRALDDIALRPAAYIGLGRTMDAQGRGELALKYFERARRLRPGDATAYREIGYHQYLAGDLDAAIDSFRTATVLLPDDADLWASLGGLYLSGGEIAAATAAFERSLAIDPDYGALSNFGSLRYEQRDYAGAAELYRRAAEMEPGDFRIWGNLADALAAVPATAAQAREPYRRAADMATDYIAVRDTDAQALALLAWYRANLGDTEVAVQRMRQSRALAGESAEVAFFNAQTLALLGDAAGARDRLGEARAAGVTPQRVNASPVLRRLLAGASAHGGAS